MRDVQRDVQEAGRGLTSLPVRIKAVGWNSICYVSFLIVEREIEVYAPNLWSVMLLCYVHNQVGKSYCLNVKRSAQETLKRTILILLLEFQVCA